MPYQNDRCYVFGRGVVWEVPLVYMSTLRYMVLVWWIYTFYDLMNSLTIYAQVFYRSPSYVLSLADGFNQAIHDKH
jgi:hypothetical protein